MSKCKKVRSLLALRPADRDAGEQARVEAHLVTCPDCAALDRDYAEQRRLIRSGSSARLAPAQRDQLLSQIQQERRHHTMTTRLLAILSTAAAVVAILAVGITVQVLLPAETPTALPTEPTATAIGTETKSNLAHYSNSALGFAVDYPSSWDVTPQQYKYSIYSHSPPDPPESYTVYLVEFTTGLHSSVHPAEEYRIQVFVSLGSERTSLEEEVDNMLSTVKHHIRERSRTQCCRVIGGERAMEILVDPGLAFLPGEVPTTATPSPDPGQRKIITIHNGQVYGLYLEPDPYAAPADTAAQAAFGTFLSSFTFIPITVVPTPTPPPPGFELGGHIYDESLPFADHMRQAGMTWAKVQVHYPQDATSIIEAAHAEGFKIQLTALGTPSMVTQPGFEQDFADWVAGLAAAGADAIEVWNEPNIDQEWQNGHIDPAAYTRLLCTCHYAIRYANPATVVISAAPASASYLEGCGPDGCDDIPFLQGMYNAGAAQCMDYIGAHYNAGATSPSARSGHPADDGDQHHSWYFLPQTELYHDALQGTHQLFYTEMGYASQEGVPPFSDWFSWARGTTDDQQAAWLAEAAQLSVDTGLVRGIIVWNVDFPRAGYDPADGYAIIRPDGSCPACDALHEVMPR